MTLIELLVTMVVLVFALGALMSLYLSCLRSYAATASDGSAQAQARWAVRDALPRLREVGYISNAESNYLRWYPSDPGAVPPDMGVQDHVLAIYPGSAEGTPDTEAGDHLWLASNESGNLAPVELLADDLVPGTGVQFTYILSSGTELSTLTSAQKKTLRAISMTVTTRQSAHGQSHEVVQEGTAVLCMYRPDAGG